MTAVLNLTDGTTTIDFLNPANLDFSLRQNGLQIDLPDVHRPGSGVSLLYEGEQIADRQYGNREIKVKFKLQGANHDDLIANFRSLTRLIETAHRTNRDGFGSEVSLQYKLDNASDTVVFDVIDGEFEPGEFAAVLVRRNSLFLDAEITLLCKPFARLAAPVALNNYLLNPFFNWNSGAQGRDGGYMIDFNGTNQYMANAAITGLYSTTTPTCFSFGLWFKRDTLAGTLMWLVQVGTTTEAWRLQLTTSNLLTFVWTDSAAATHTVTSSAAPSANVWHFASGTVFSTNGADQVTVLMIDGQVVATLTDATAKTIRTPVGGINFCTSVTVTQLFDGKLEGFFMTKNVPILPYHLHYIYLYGMRGLFSTAASLWGGETSVQETPVLPQTWLGLPSSVLSGCWPFDEAASPVLDKSGNGRNLTLTNSPAITVERAAPNSWSVGSSLTGATQEGLFASPSPFGPFVMRFNGTQNANRYISQVATVPAVNSTLCIVLNNLSGGVQTVDVSWDASNFTLAAPTGRSYWLLTRIPSASTTVKIGRHITAGTLAINVEAVMLSKGTPFGVYDPTPGNVTANPPPLVGSRYVRALDGPGESCFVPVFGLPGDVPATCRLRLRPSTTIYAPIRVGCHIGGSPYRQVHQLRASLMIPNRSNLTAYQAAAMDNPSLLISAGTVIKDRAAVSLPTLFPFPLEQAGQFKVFIGIEGRVDCVYPARISALDQVMSLSGDPAREINSTATTHVLDSGILSWPPDAMITKFREGNLSGQHRVDAVIPSPLLSIASIADTANVNIDLLYFFLLPVGGGFFALTAPASSGVNPAGGLQTAERLVIDTIDEQMSPGYVTRELTLPNVTGTVDAGALVGGDLSMYGSGFYLPPQTDINFVFNINSWGGAADLMFGAFVEQNYLEVDFEYMPRFLYV